MPSSGDHVAVANITVNKYAYNTVLESREQTQPASDTITTATLCFLLGESSSLSRCVTFIDLSLGLLTIFTGVAVYLLVLVPFRIHSDPDTC